jgi:glycosyltransferase involved in cell wall biosynthesis
MPASPLSTGSIPVVDVSVVIPVFGDGAELDELTARIAHVFTPRRTSWEVILVDDGSPPQTWEAISALAATQPNVRGISLARNFGQHNALLAGIRAASGHVVVTLDDDLQHPPEEIPRLLDALDGYDVVYGTPVERVRGLVRNLAAVVSKAALASVVGASHARHIGAFRAFRSVLRSVFHEYDSPYVSIDVLLSWSANRIAAVPVKYAPRRRGRSGYRLWPLVTLTVNMVTGFSVWPLRIASIVGLAFAGLGAVVLAFVLVRYLTAGTAVPGFAFLASIIAIFSGAQLFSLGVIGEYLARMYFRALDRPAFIVRSTANFPVVESALRQ